MNKTQEMIQAVNANIKKLTNMRYAVEQIGDLTAKRAEVIYSHPAMGDGWNYHVVFTRHHGKSVEWIGEMEHESHAKGWDEGAEVRRVKTETLENNYLSDWERD